MSIIISTSNKSLYNSPKSFCLIVLLNMLGKLIEKVIEERMQSHSISNNFIHLNQFRELKQCSTTDVNVFLTHLIYSGWIKNSQTSMLAFDIAQFFPLLNQHLLSLILDKARFNHKISSFFSDYLIGRKTQYFWNSFSFHFFNVNVGVGQDSALLPIFSALYLSPLFYIFEKCAKNLKIPVSLLSFIDNGFFVSQGKSLEKSYFFLFCNYNIFPSLLDQFRLVIEHGKTEIFHFSRICGPFNSPPLDLSHIKDPVLSSKEIW